MRITLCLPLLLTALLTTLTASAANGTDTNKGLFQATVKVANQNPAELDRALPKAFSEILRRLTADRAITKAPWAHQAIGNARHYLAQFKYEQRSDTEAEITYLIADFNPSAVTKLLEQNGVAYWSSTRPTVIAWVLSENGGSRQIISSNSSADLAEPLTQAAQQAGVNLVLPLMDLQEQGQIHTDDLLVQDTDLLEQATDRYGSKVFILGQLRALNDDRWSAEWLLSIDSKLYRWPAERHAELMPLLRRGMTAISLELFELYSHQPLSTDARSEIRITGITDIAGYQRTWNYLAKLQGVISVVPYSFVNGQAEFTIQHSGNWSELNRLILLGDTLIAPPATSFSYTSVGATMGTVGQPSNTTNSPSATSIPSTIRRATPSYQLNN